MIKIIASVVLLLVPPLFIVPAILLGRPAQYPTVELLTVVGLTVAGQILGLLLLLQGLGIWT